VTKGHLIIYCSFHTSGTSDQDSWSLVSTVVEKSIEQAAHFKKASCSSLCLFPHISLLFTSSRSEIVFVASPLFTIHSHSIMKTASLFAALSFSLSVFAATTVNGNTRRGQGQKKRKFILQVPVPQCNCTFFQNGSGNNGGAQSSTSSFFSHLV
jgi:hypothetical protein